MDLVLAAIIMQQWIFKCLTIVLKRMIIATSLLWESAICLCPSFPQIKFSVSCIPEKRPHFIKYKNVKLWDYFLIGCICLIQ